MQPVYVEASKSFHLTYDTYFYSLHSICR